MELENIAEIEVEIQESGPPGLSAYEIYLRNGGTLSETEWLESLKGKDGEPGIPGEPGAQGEPGTTIYSELTNKPSINNVTLEGNKTLEELGIQPAGDYGTIPDWNQNDENAPDYIKNRIGGYESYEEIPVFENKTVTLTKRHPNDPNDHRYEYSLTDEEFNLYQQHFPYPEMTSKFVYEGKEYVQTGGYDVETYTCQTICDTDTCHVCIPNLHFIWVDFYDAESVNTEFTFSLYKLESSIVPIPIKFLPDIVATKPYINESISNINLTETDPTVPAHVKAITEEQITKWDSSIQTMNIFEFTSPLDLGTMASYNSPKVDIWDDIAEQFGQAMLNASNTDGKLIIIVNFPDFNENGSQSTTIYQERFVFLQKQDQIIVDDTLRYYTFGSQVVSDTHNVLKDLPEVSPMRITCGIQLDVDGTVKLQDYHFTVWYTPNRFLSINNTNAFTPTKDYHPATKKYVDDAIAAITNGDEVSY